MIGGREILSASGESRGAYQGFDQMVKPVRFGLGVGVDEGNDLTGSRRDTGVTGGAESAVGERNHARTFVGGDTRGIVARTVVDDDYLVVGIIEKLEGS